MDAQDNIMTGIFEYDRQTGRLYLHPDEKIDSRFINLNIQTENNSNCQWVGYDDKPMPTVNRIRLTIDQNQLGEVLIVNPLYNVMQSDDAIAHAKAKGRQIAAHVLINTESKEIEGFADILAV